jgi:hypothetical protein
MNDREVKPLRRKRAVRSMRMGERGEPRKSARSASGA